MMDIQSDPQDHHYRKNSGGMAAEYGFTDQQLEMLQELLEERELLADLIGSLMNVTADARRFY